MASTVSLKLGNAPMATEVGALTELGKDYEIVDGQLVEEPPLGAHELWIASFIARVYSRFDQDDQIGQMIVEMIFDLQSNPRLRRRPDVAFVSAQRWPIDKPAPSEAAWDIVPDLAVEIISPTDLINDLMKKIEEYFAAGVRLVWVVYPKYRKIYVYKSLTSIIVLDQNGTLDGGEIIPGFAIQVDKIFKTEGNDSKPTIM